MRIALVNKFMFELGGSQSVLLAEAELLRRGGHELCFFGVRHPESTDLEGGEFFSEYFDLSGTQKSYSPFQKLRIAARMIYNRSARQQFGAFLDHYRPDLVHCHSIYHHLSPSIFDSARTRRIPVVQTVHDYHLVCPNHRLMRGLVEVCSDTRCFGGKYWHCVRNRCVKGSRSASMLGALELAVHRGLKFYERGVREFLAPSKFMLELCRKSGIPAEQLTYLPNCAPTKFMASIHDSRPEGSKVALATSADRQSRRTFLFFGRLSFEKGIKTLVKAFFNLPEHRLLIVGRGPQEAELRQIVKEAGCSHIEFVGYRTGKELYDTIRNAFMVVLPAEWYENAPMSIIEAFALGKPVIGTRIGGIPEMVEDGKTGRLVKPGDTEELTDTLRACARMTPDRYRTVSAACRAEVEKRYSPEQHYTQLMRIYQRHVDQQTESN
jgi:glycosyltransferase involved in cell wall biosynthesis